MVEGPSVERRPAAGRRSPRASAGSGATTSCARWPSPSGLLNLFSQVSGGSDRALRPGGPRDLGGWSSPSTRRAAACGAVSSAAGRPRRVLQRIGSEQYVRRAGLHSQLLPEPMRLETAEAVQPPTTPPRRRHGEEGELDDRGPEHLLAVEHDESAAHLAQQVEHAERDGQGPDQVVAPEPSKPSAISDRHGRRSSTALGFRSRGGDDGEISPADAANVPASKMIGMAKPTAAAGWPAVGRRTGWREPAEYMRPLARSRSRSRRSRAGTSGRCCRRSPRTCRAAAWRRG